MPLARLVKTFRSPFKHIQKASQRTSKDLSEVFSRSLKGLFMATQRRFKGIDTVAGTDTCTGAGSGSGTGNGTGTGAGTGIVTGPGTRTVNGTSNGTGADTGIGTGTGIGTSLRKEPEVLRHQKPQRLPRLLSLTKDCNKNEYIYLKADCAANAA